MVGIIVQDLKEGYVTAAPVTTKRGQELIKAGEKLTRQMISRMEFYGIESVQIEEISLIDPKLLAAMSANAPAEPEPEPMPEPEPAPTQEVPKNEVAYSQQIKRSEAFQKYSIASSSTTVLLQQQLEGFVNEGTSIDLDQLLDSVKSLITPGQTVIQYFDMLHNMRSLDDSVYSHSLNVAMISRIIGKWLKWNTNDLDVLVLAGLLHDIGKVIIPDEVLNKEGKLTDEEFALIKSHPMEGYKLIKDLKIDPRIKKATLMHHERCDGSGYPNGVDEIMIDDFAMIIAIADVYDAMTAARKYRAPMCPFQVIRQFERDGYQMYKTEYLLTFLKHIATTYQNNRVLLNDGRAGKIILLNPNALSSPLVQLDDNTCIDLATSPLYIQSIV